MKKGIILCIALSYAFCGAELWASEKSVTRIMGEITTLDVTTLRGHRVKGSVESVRPLTGSIELPDRAGKEKDAIFPLDYSCGAGNLNAPYWVYSGWYVGNEIYYEWFDHCTQCAPCNQGFEINEFHAIWVVEGLAPSEQITIYWYWDVHEAGDLGGGCYYPDATHCRVPPSPNVYSATVTADGTYDITTGGHTSADCPLLDCSGPYFQSMWIDHETTGSAILKPVTDDDGCTSCLSWNDWGIGLEELCSYGFYGNWSAWVEGSCLEVDPTPTLTPTSTPTATPTGPTPTPTSTPTATPTGLTPTQPPVQPTAIPTSPVVIEETPTPPPTMPQAEIVLNGASFSQGDSFTATFQLNESITRPFTAFAVIILPNGAMLNALTLDTPLTPVATNVPSLSAPFTFPLINTTIPAGAPAGTYELVVAFFDPTKPITGRSDAFLVVSKTFSIQ